MKPSLRKDVRRIKDQKKVNLPLKIAAKMPLHIKSISGCVRGLEAFIGLKREVSLTIFYFFNFRSAVCAKQEI